MAPPIKPTPTKGGPVAGTATAIALTMAVVALMPLEGKENDPYLDIVKVKTVCYGETEGFQDRHYSDQECKDMLIKAVGERYLKPVLKCTPTLGDKPEVLAAATVLAYNIGVGSYCTSTADRRFDAGDYAGGCQAFARFNSATYSHPQPKMKCTPKKDGRWLCVVPGLVNRRNTEIALCERGLK